VLPEAATNHEATAAVPDILVIEDERISRMALVMLLKSCGYHPAAYESAEQALEYLGHSPLPLVMLVDVDLPGMSGMELIEQIRRNHPAFRAVLITAAEGDRIARFRRDNAVDYLRKPVNFDRLLQLLDRFGIAHHDSAIN
jgi:CheY-like chemotaxis protein